ncbi:MAG: PspA/IM30 family protein [Gemmatimonadota bacterium]
MFGKLRTALEEALTRLERRSGSGVEEDVNRLLRSMREELIEAKARVPEMEAHLELLERRRVAEKTRAEDCVRRAAQAEAIDDEETREVAERFAKQHLARGEVLEQKIQAARAELTLHREEVDRMTAHLKDAIARQDALAIQARRARTIETTGGAGSDLLEELERVTERMSRPSDLEAAERQLDRELEGEPDPADDPELSRLDREARAEELLRELKRRMGVERGNG